MTQTADVTHHRTVTIDGVDLFYREAGSSDAPAVVLLHGFPSSSRMYRSLIPQLAVAHRVIAPDYPGFGHSAVPDRAAFPYTFDGLADITEKLLDELGVGSFALYVMDFGAPVGYRLALRHPERLLALVVQNAPLYPESADGWWTTLGEYWQHPSEENRDAARSYLTPETTRAQYLYGVRDTSVIDPDTWTIDSALMGRAGVDEIMLDLLYDIRNNVSTFRAMQQLLAARGTPVLVSTGAHDEIFPEAAVRQIRDHLPATEFHALDTEHFALEDSGAEIGALVLEFLGRVLPRVADGAAG